MNQKQIKNARQIGFIFNQINDLTIKIYSNLSNMNIRYYLNLRIPIMRRQVLKRLSQNLDYVKTHCTDRNNLFHFSIRN